MRALMDDIVPGRRGQALGLKASKTAHPGDAFRQLSYTLRGGAVLLFSCCPFCGAAILDNKERNWKAL